MSSISGTPPPMKSSNGCSSGFTKLLILVGCALYVLSPIDFIVDVVPVVGWIDDIAVIALTARSLVND